MEVRGGHENGCHFRVKNEVCALMCRSCKKTISI